MKTVAGEGKKSEILGGPAEEGESGEGARRRAQILDAPTKILNTPHRHNTTHTQHNAGILHRVVFGKGGSLAGRSMAQKSRHEQQSVPKSSPIAQGFLVSRMVLKGLGTKRFDQKKDQEAVWAKSGQKNQKTWKNKEKTTFSLSPKTKNNVITKIEKNPQNQKKNGKISLLTPSRPKKIQKQNQKIES